MRRNRTRGLTQFELMISLAIMGMIGVFLAGTLQHNLQILERSRLLSDETSVLLTRRSFRGWVGDIPTSLAGMPANELFEGGADTLRFRTLVSDGSFWSGELAEFTLMVRTKNGQKTLVATGTGRHPNSDVRHEVSRTLAGSVESVAIRYFGRASSTQSRGWQNSWTDDKTLPELVKIEWEIRDGTPVPPLTLRPGKREGQRAMSLSSLLPPG